MRGIVIFQRDDHYRPTIATWTRGLSCMFTGSLTGEKDEVSFDMTYTYAIMVFKGLSIHIARFHNQSMTGGGEPIR